MYELTIKLAIALVMFLGTSLVYATECRGPSLENIKLTQQEREFMDYLAEQEELIADAAILLEFAPILSTAGGRWWDVAFSVSTTDWESHANAVAGLQKIHTTKTAGEIRAFIVTKNPKNRKFFNALLEHYRCLGSS